MGLIVEDLIKSNSYLKPENAASVYLAVQDKYLSVPYELHEGSIITGQILGITDIMGRGVEEVKNLIGSTITFVIVNVVGTDYLFISRDSWPLLRDYGIMPEDYKLRVKIISARVNEEEIEIYPRIEKVV
ncbi:MAG: hypothetical protein EMLJLAPB_00952 [Candidatus Argoarchaeum ethanivorans]|uniref:Uncharacterized protein n=1 Tax=Candidatus Argoarchaeum ethanivorans TaxID=2608793 RepID=A0A811TGD6_9EURY|nr:MAG: hypothetical protein EMLJLAPB_00952 [Candidatus Argoarchaeum ethanivorans]